MKNDKYEELFSDEPIENIKLDIELIKKNLSNYSNEKLCEMIVCDRYFGFEEKISPICMEELGRRRLAGDVFNFENYIDQVYNQLPVIDLTIPDVRSILNQAIGRKFKQK